MGHQRAASWMIERPGEIALKDENVADSGNTGRLPVVGSCSLRSEL